MLPSAKDPLSIHCLAPLLLGPQFGHHPFTTRKCPQTTCLCGWLGMLPLEFLEGTPRSAPPGTQHSRCVAA